MLPKREEPYPKSVSAPPVTAKVPGEEGQWTTGLFHCFKDPINCIVTSFCPCVTFGRNARILERSSCVWSGVFYILLAPFCLSSCCACAYRSKLRGQFTLPGEPCRDFLAHCFCPFCAICQEYRELKHHGLYDQPSSTHPNPDPKSVSAPPVTAKVPGKEGQWTTGLFSCCKDPINCIVTLFCPCVTFGRNARILERSSCKWSGIFYTLLAPFCLSSCYGCAHRSKLRGQFTLPGEPCRDFLAHCFCPFCAICQEYRELKHHGLYDQPSDKRKIDRRENWYHTTPPGDIKGATWLPRPSHPDGLTATAFTYEELEMATDGFADANLLGKGGFGNVYKGVLANGRVVAVKQLKSGNRLGEREFHVEIEIISRVHHRNPVSLVGYCTTETQRILVYEFVSNHDLEFHLHGKGKPAMDWSTRLKVAVGFSSVGQPRIIHRDIKASNILLDDHFEAKVADFGTAKYFLDTETHVSTRIMGTFGYLAPEYASTGQLTNKSDVYSFGVVLLQLITGLQPVVRTSPATEYYHASLVDLCQPLIKQSPEGGSHDDLVDPRMQNNYDTNQMTRMIACAAACVRSSARLRPQMSQIVRALEGNMSLDELNEWTVPGYSHHHEEILETFEDETVSESLEIFEVQEGTTTS